MIKVKGLRDNNKSQWPFDLVIPDPPTKCPHPQPLKHTLPYKT